MQIMFCVYLLFIIFFSLSFRKCHPEQFPTPEMRQHATTSEGPDKPHTAFNIFVGDRLKKPEFSQVNLVNVILMAMDVGTILQ